MQSSPSNAYLVELNLFHSHVVIICKTVDPRRTIFFIFVSEVSNSYFYPFHGCIGFTEYLIKNAKTIWSEHWSLGFFLYIVGHITHINWRDRDTVDILFLHRPRIPLEHLREEKLAEAGICFGLGHEAQKLIGVVQEGILDTAVELVAPQVINVAGFEGGA